MPPHYYYAQNYASLIRQGLTVLDNFKVFDHHLTTVLCVVAKKGQK